MYDAGVVKIPQSFNGVRELEGFRQVMTRNHVVVAHQLQVITSVGTDVLRDVTVGHPFGNHRQPPFPEGVRDSDEVKNVGMGQVLPHGDLFAEALYNA